LFLSVVFVVSSCNEPMPLGNVKIFWVRVEDKNWNC
jgi:hypothetical protein